MTNNLKEILNNKIESLDISRLNVIKALEKQKKSKFKSSRIEFGIKIEKNEILRKIININYIINQTNDEQKTICNEEINIFKNITKNIAYDIWKVNNLNIDNTINLIHNEYNKIKENKIQVQEQLEVQEEEEEEKCKKLILYKNNNNLLKLKNELKELIYIFNNLNELIILQDDKINTINDNISKSEIIVEEGKKEIVEASKYNKKIYGMGIIITSGIIGSIVSYPITLLFLSSKASTGGITLIGGLLGILSSKRVLDKD